ncbi:unnamed protein product [Paramecium primaurelia]|uniref:Uncharacterized protein n=2 Tax=Paramecium TaxID=5884 RepID=A0A8S1SL02_9CILI|nr:unnamed protein product [Paramecium primaurelia]CAD8141315.1 unnamed protein product [Paramecium pentaurelia]
MDTKKLSKIIELIFLSIAWLSVLACLIRTDFNFPFAFFCYYLWISRDDKANSLMLMVLNGILILVDLIWLLSVGSIWTATEKNNPVWGKLHGLHVFVIFISIVNALLKVGAIVAINSYRGNQQQVAGPIGSQNPQQSGFNDMSQNRQQPFAQF